MKAFTIIFLGPNFESATVIMRAENPVDAVIAATDEIVKECPYWGMTVPVGIIEGEHSNIIDQIQEGLAERMKKHALEILKCQTNQPIDPQSIN